MSSSVDNRIVKMTFDHKQFERGVASTLSSLKNLKKGLNLSGAAKNIQDLEKTGNKFDISNISSGVDKISKRFSIFGIVGVESIRNITSSLIRMGKEALRGSYILMGLEEYETKMNAIKTILANTKANGTDLDDINVALGELNDYSDNTVYNFAQMTDMVGKFAATSGELDSSVGIVKGLANLAAEAGVSNQALQSTLYQVSQAMSGEAFQKMDWNSLENAGIATKKFRTDLIAMGKEMGAFDTMPDMLRRLEEETIGLGMSLESGWLKTDVFQAVAEMYALDQSMIDAAGEVTTLSKLWIVMKETLQSGWTVSWEEIIGDKTESAKLLTAISESFKLLTAPAAAARNEMLGFWNENGGREDIIMALVNTFKYLYDILTPIKEAFEEVFPPRTGQQLVDLSAKIRAATEKLMASEEFIANIKATFKGLFSAISIGQTIFKGFITIVTGLFKAFSGKGSGSILEITGAIGSFVTNIDEATKNTTFFTDIMGVVGGVITTIMTPFRNLIGIIKELASTMDISPMVAAIKNTLESFGASIASVFESLSTLRTNGGVKSLLDIQEKLAGAGSKIAVVVNFLKKAVSGFKDVLAELFEGASIERTSEVLKNGLFGGGIFLIAKEISGLLRSGKDFVGGLTDILDGVRGSLEAYQTNIKATAILKIAGAVAILAAALTVMSMLDPEKLETGMLAITALFVNIFASMKGLSIVTKGTGVGSLIAVTTSMIGFSLAILLLAGALKKLSKIDGDSLKLSMIALTGATVMLTGMAKILDKTSKGLTGKALGVVVFAGALYVLAGALKKIGQMESDVLIKGILGLGGMMVSLIAFIKITDKAELSIKTGVTIIAIAVAIRLLAGAVEKFGKIDTNVITKGIIAVSALLVAIAVFNKISGNTKGMVAAGIGLAIISVGLKGMASSIEAIGNIDTDVLTRGIIGIGGALLAIGIGVRLMPKSLPLIGVGLLIVAQSLFVINDALGKMAENTKEEIYRGLIALGGALGIIAIAVAAMSGSLAGAAALVIVSLSLRRLVTVLKLFGNMEIQTILTGLAAMAAVFAVIGAAALILGPIVPVLASLAGSIMLLGVAAIASGIGLSLLAVGLLAIGSAISVVTPMAIGIAKALAEGFVQMLDTMAENSIKIRESIKTLVLSMLTLLAELIPEGVAIIMEFITTMLEKVAEFTPKLVALGYEIVLAILEGIESNIEQMVDVGIGIVVGFINGVAGKIGDVIEAGVNLIISFLTGLADAIEKNTLLVVKAIDRLFVVVMEAALEVLLYYLGNFVEVGKTLIGGLISGIWGALKWVLDTVVKINTAIRETFLLLVKKLWTVAGDIMGGLIDGIDNAIKKVVTVVSDINTAVSEKIKELIADFTGIGGDIVAGLAKGIKDTAGNAVNAVKDMGSGVLNGAKDFFDINSPAKEFYYVGEMVTEGERLGIEENTYKVVNAASKMHEGALNAVKEPGDAILKHFTDLFKKPEVLEDLETAATEAGEVVPEGISKGVDNKAPMVANSTRKMAEKAGISFLEETKKWIDQKKFYNELSLLEELTAWESVQAKYKEGSEERMKADEQVYTLRKQLVAEITAIEEEYSTSSKEVNDQAITDIKELNAAYKEAVDQRTEAIYEAYGLFEKLEKADPIDPDVLTANLKAQVRALKTWRWDVEDLTEKGVSEDLMDELVAMGPKAAAQIDALSDMSEPQLDEYVKLWQKKHNLARTQAEAEHIGMKNDLWGQSQAILTNSNAQLDNLKAAYATKMGELRATSEADVIALRMTWTAEIAKLRGQSEADIEQLKTNIIGKMKVLKSGSLDEVAELRTESAITFKGIRVSGETEVDELRSAWGRTISSIRTDTKLELEKTQEDIRNMKWAAVGEDIVKGLIAGVNSEMSSLKYAVKQAALEALAAAKRALEINSPSKAFFTVGAASMAGMAGGISSGGGAARDAGRSIGNSYTSGVKEALEKQNKNMPDWLKVDPIIRPVLDLSDFKKKAKEIPSILDTRTSGIAKGISSSRAATMDTQKAAAKTNQQQKDVSFVQNNYSPKALSRVDIYRQSKNLFKSNQLR